MFDAITGFDFSVLDAIQNTFKCGFLDAVMPIITLFAEYGIFWIAIAAVMLCFKKTRKTGWIMGVALILGVIIGNAVLKPIFARIRPYDIPGREYIRETLLIAPLTDYSFPSGHSLACFEASIPLMYYSKKFGIPALILSVLVCFSRLYLYVHYPSDVIAGIVLGTLFAFAAKLIIDKIYGFIEKKKVK